MFARERQKKLAIKSHDGEDVDLFQLRSRFSSRQAADKRDLFYGLLSLVTKWSSSPQPNYAIPLREAITGAAFACVRACGREAWIF